MNVVQDIMRPSAETRARFGVPLIWSFLVWLSAAP